MTGGPFEFDNSEPTVLKGDELEKLVKQFGGRRKVVKKPEAKADEKPAAKAEKKAEAK